MARRALELALDVVAQKAYFVRLLRIDADFHHFVDQKEAWRKLPYEARLDPDYAIIPIIPYAEAKMELRDFIAEESGDKDYAYGKDDGDSYSHGQIDVFLDKNINPLGLQSLNVAVCDNGDIIRRDQLDDIDPFDFIIP